MNTFVKNMEDYETRTLTQNGCGTFTTSLNANVDMFSQCSSMRENSDMAVNLFKLAFAENANLAIRNLFYLRDVRGGQGERKIFRECSHWLIDNIDDNAFYKFVRFISEYGRWDDVIDLLSYMYFSFNAKKMYSEKIRSVMILLRNQLNEDLKNMVEMKSISLLSKWFPLANNTKNKTKKILAKYLAKMLFGTEKVARKIIVDLRSYMNVLEQKISKNAWNDVDYSTVPSCANRKYAEAFMRHDEQRYSKFIEEVNNGTAKMNSSALYPYEIVVKAQQDRFKGKTEWDAMWKSLPDYTNGHSAICVVDVSGSMGWFLGYDSKVEPIHIALSLGLYFAERNKGDFANKFITFSESPKIEFIKGNSLADKLNNMHDSNWGMNTDIEKVFDLYLKLAKKSKKEDCPESIIIISDMEFDVCCDSSYTFFESVKNKFEREGIQLPSLVFWNVNASGVNVPVRYDEHGTILISGKSPSTFAYVMSGTTPEKFMLDVLNGKRYNTINIFEKV